MGDGYAVIDFETTGFRALTTDRVVEIGVVCMDHSGEVVDEWTSLVNPERDVSAGAIHGITARDVYGAPRFAELAGLLTDSLRDRVLVAHNLSFEAQFLMGEFTRLGHDLQLDRHAGICTMTLASTYLPRSPRNLQACCDCCGVDLRDAHSALADARATTQLLGRYISSDSEFAERWADRCAASLSIPWPALPADRAAALPRSSPGVGSADVSYTGRLASRLQATGGSGVVDSYLEVLDRALIDRVLALHEIDELIDLALALGLSREQLDIAHRAYVRALVRQAWADSVVTDEETDDLLRVGALLGIEGAEVQASLSAEAAGASHADSPACLATVGAFALEPGDKIVFTGEAPGTSRDELIREAEASGLKVTSSVSRRTKVVVAADPDSISGRARKARDYGVPVVDYAAYLRLRDQMRRAEDR
jgi:DNA polymerase-3 subunit epsilon